MKKMIEENIEKTIEKTLSFSTLTMKITRIGRDYNIILMGGQMPHIGCTVLAKLLYAAVDFIWIIFQMNRSKKL